MRHVRALGVQVIVVIDKEDMEDTAFWQEHNPSALDMAAESKVTAAPQSSLRCSPPKLNNRDSFWKRCPSQQGTVRRQPGTNGCRNSELCSGLQGSRATAFVCQNFACRAPTTDPEKLKYLLADISQSGATPAAPDAKLGKVDLSDLQAAKIPTQD